MELKSQTVVKKCIFKLKQAEVNKSCPIRAVKRKANPFTDFDAPFDPSRFNFNKVHPDEILFLLRNVEEKEPVDHKVLINLSPIDKSGGLLVPYLETNHNQRMTERSLKVVFDFMRLSKSQNLAVFFNSLMGFASVNHQHFQIIYLQQQLPILQHKDRVPLCDSVFAVEGWCCPALELLTASVSAATCIASIMRLTSLCHEHNCAFMLVLTKQGDGVQTVILPKKCDKDIGLPEDSLFFPSALESSGYLLISNKDAFDNLNENSILKVFNAANQSPGVVKELYDHISRDFP